jgi:transposase
MEGSARAVSALSDVSPKVSALGPWRADEVHPGGPGRGSTSPRANGFIGVLHRRIVRKCQRGGLDVGPTKRGKGTKLMAVADHAGLPVALHTCSASPHEVRLVDDTLIARHTEGLPERLIGDKAYDSDSLDRDLALVDVEMIAPHRDTRRRKTQDGRPLRRYRRRWKVERLFAWLFNFRRLAIRYEYHAENYLAFVQLAGVVILLRAGL